MSHATINGIRMHYRIDGQETAPWIVLSNSLATDIGLWNDLVERLRGSFHILRYDQRGHGDTEAPPGPYTFDTLIDDALALADSLRIRTAHWVGISMGGATVMGLAQRHPERVERLVVCATPCASSPASAKQWNERALLVARSGMDSIVDETLARWFTAEALATRAPRVQPVRRMILATPPAGFIGCAAALGDHDFRATLDRVRAQTLLIVGDHDASRDPMRSLHAALEHSELVELPDAGHLCHLDQPSAFREALEKFVRS